MKKLMVMVVTIGMAVASQAALCDWSYWTEDADSLSGTAYLILGSSAKSTWGSLSEISGAAVDSVTLDGGYASKTANSSSFTAGTAQNAYVVLVNDDGDLYGVTSVVSIDGEFIYKSDGTPPDFPFSSFDAIEATKPFEDVPEPTSGLLLVLGMAGLALRRRRA